MENRLVYTIMHCYPAEAYNRGGEGGWRGFVSREDGKGAYNQNFAVVSVHVSWIIFIFPLNLLLGKNTVTVKRLQP